MRTLTRLLLVLCFASSVSAQPAIFIVDEQGGPGSHFTNLPEAVAAVPDGSVLRVRPGQYSVFTLRGKGLTIAGEENVVIAAGLGETLSIEATTAVQPVLLRNLEFGGLAGADFRVTGAQGAVIFEDVRIPAEAIAFSVHSFVVQNSANVQFHRCAIGDPTTIFSMTSTPTTPARIDATDSTVQVSLSTIIGVPGPQGGFGSTGIADPGGPAIALTRSRCLAFQSTLTGGRGGTGCSSFPGCFQLSGRGGTGVVAADGSVFYALRSPVTGGPGMPAVYLSRYVEASDGGDGVHVRSGSLARFEGAMPSPGVQGGPGAPGPAGVPSVVEAGSTLLVDPSTHPPAGEIVGTQATGEIIRFTLDAEPGAVGALMLSYGPGLVPLEPLLPGSLLAGIVHSVGPVSVPGTGIAQLPFRIPSSGWPVGQTYYGQWVTLQIPANLLWVSNSFPWHTSR